MSAHQLNLAVIVAYLVIIVCVGLYFSLKRKSADQFMTAKRHMPGWAVGFSMFGSYISAQSFIGNPATTFKGNWLYAAFTAATPIGLLIGTTVFMRFYRRSGAVSAYEHLEHRFGRWARSYAVLTYLFLQTARTGTILFLLARAVLPLLSRGRDDVAMLTWIIVGIGVLITLYTLWGGIESVVWCGVIQSVVLLVGPLVLLVTLLLKMPGGPVTVFQIAVRDDKFGFGPYGLDLLVPTLWILVINAVLEHLRNWGTDQSYIQRYVSTPNEREAAKSIWIAGLLYMPVAFTFFFLGTALYAFYAQSPGLLPEGTAPDGVLPYFISSQVAPGLAGLVIAAVFAASMDSNLNSMATLTLLDGYKRYLRPQAGDRESLVVLWSSTAFWGALSVAWGLLVMYMTLKNDRTVIEFTYAISGLIAGGVLGLLLLGLLAPRVGSGSAFIATATGVAVILWMTLSQVKVGTTTIWPDTWPVSPVHEIYAGFVGTSVILVFGVLLSVFFPRRIPVRLSTT